MTGSRSLSEPRLFMTLLCQGANVAYQDDRAWEFNSEMTIRNCRSLFQPNIATHYRDLWRPAASFMSALSRDRIRDNAVDGDIHEPVLIMPVRLLAPAVFTARRNCAHSVSRNSD